MCELSYPHIFLSENVGCLVGRQMKYTFPHDETLLPSGSDMYYENLNNGQRDKHPTRKEPKGRSDVETRPTECGFEKY